MYRFCPTTAPTNCVLLGSLLFFAFHSHVQSAEPADDAAAAALVKIKQLGGTVRTIAVNSKDLEVNFHLGGRELTDEELAHVAALKNVVSLNLKDTQITNAGLVHLKGLTQLRQLHLERTAVGDDGIENLKGLVNLGYLNLYATNITDQALLQLTELKNLKRLYVWQTAVTDAGVARLEKALPNLLIVRGVDFSKLPAPPPSKPPVPVKWIAAGNGEPPRSTSGSNTEVIFENRSDRRVKVVWIGYDGNPRLYHKLNPGETKRQNTYANNTWLITDDNDKPLGHFLVGPDVSRAVIPNEK